MTMGGMNSRARGPSAAATLARPAWRDRSPFCQRRICVRSRIWSRKVRRASGFLSRCASSSARCWSVNSPSQAASNSGQNSSAIGAGGSSAVLPVQHPPDALQQHQADAPQRIVDALRRAAQSGRQSAGPGRRRRSRAWTSCRSPSPSLSMQPDRVSSPASSPPASRWATSASRASCSSGFQIALRRARLFWKSMALFCAMRSAQARKFVPGWNSSNFCHKHDARVLENVFRVVPVQQQGVDVGEDLAGGPLEQVDELVIACWVGHGSTANRHPCVGRVSTRPNGRVDSPRTPRPDAVSSWYMEIDAAGRNSPGKSAHNRRFRRCCGTQRRGGRCGGDFLLRSPFFVPLSAPFPTVVLAGGSTMGRHAAVP